MFSPYRSISPHFFSQGPTYLHNIWHYVQTVISNKKIWTCILTNYSHSTIEENTIRVECFYSFGVASLLVALEEVILGGPGIQSANTEDALANITRRGAHLTTVGIPA